MANNQDTVLLIAGDRKVLKKLFDRYSREMYYFALGLTNDHLVAEDALQESFIYMWNHRQQLNPAYSISGYLRQCIKHNILNYFRYQKMRERHQEEVIREQLFLNEESVDFSAIIEKIRSVIDTLPENCRKIFLMAVIEGKGYAETAETLDISVNTVKTQVRLAYKKIRSNLNEIQGELPLALIIYALLDQ